MASRKGSPNKNKQALIALLQAKYPEYHPVLEMAKIANDTDAEPMMRFNANKEVAQYVTPKLKAVEITGEIINRNASELTDEAILARIGELEGRRNPAQGDTEAKDSKVKVH